MITFITDPYIIDPLGIAYLSAMLKRAGHQVELKLIDQIENGEVISAPIVGYSVTTGKHAYFAEFNAWLQVNYPNTISLFGGAHCSFFPDFARKRGVDYICVGEGFGAVVDFVEAAIKDKALGRNEKDKIPNIGFYTYEDDLVVVNPLRPQMKLSELPFPDREIIYQFPKNATNPIRNVMASFGCPYRCSYCYNQRWSEMGYTLRIRSIDSVIEECEKLVKDYPTRLIYFQDDNFPIHRQDWLEAFCMQYQKRVQTPFHIQVRAEWITEDKLTMLKSAGLHGMTFAIESASKVIREKILNRKDRKVGNDHFVAVSKLLRQHGIKFRIENMVGLPYETFQSACKTLDLNIQCKPNIGWASIYTPYPGTKLGDYCHQTGLIEKKGWQMDFFSNSKLKLHRRKHIERLQKLFGLICAIPILRPLTPFLVRLPFRYNILYQKVKKFLYNKKLFRVSEKGKQNVQTSKMGQSRKKFSTDFLSSSTTEKGKSN